MLGQILGFGRVLSGSFLLTSRKKLRNAGYCSGRLLFLAVVLPFLVALLYSFSGISTSLWGWIFVLFVSIAISASNFVELFAIKMDAFSKLAPLQGCAIVFNLLLGILFLDEVPTPLQFFGIFIVIVGVYFQENDGKLTFDFQFLKNKAFLFFILGSLLTSIAFLFLKKALVFVSPIEVLHMKWLLTLPITYFCYLLYRRNHNHEKTFKGNTFWIAVLMVSEMVTSLLNVVTLYFLPLVTASIIFSTSILFNPFFGKLFFKEKIALRIVPTLLIFFGVVALIGT